VTESENGRRRDSIFAGTPGPPSRPFRNSALFYGALAAIGFVFLLATGQSADRAAIGAVFAFALATGWTWLHLSRAKREQRRRERRRAP
jgi:ABC-type Mn2+/Zn2+ transport system permease subunit